MSANVTGVQIGGSCLMFLLPFLEQNNLFLQSNGYSKNVQSNVVKGYICPSDASNWVGVPNGLGEPPGWSSGGSSNASGPYMNYWNTAVCSYEGAHERPRNRRANSPGQKDWGRCQLPQSNSQSAQHDREVESEAERGPHGLSGIPFLVQAALRWLSVRLAIRSSIERTWPFTRAILRSTEASSSRISLRRACNCARAVSRPAVAILLSFSSISSGCSLFGSSVDRWDNFMSSWRHCLLALHAALPIRTFGTIFLPGCS
jgi:hypothetical protein